jgi:hypothetical protein
MPRNLRRWAESISGSWLRISVKARIEVSGVRSLYRERIVLKAVELLQALVRRAQLGGRGLELARLLLELVAVHDDLRSLVEDLAHLVERERLLLHHRGDHDARRGGADRAGELGLDEMHELGVRRHRLLRPTQPARLRVVPERFVRALRAEEPGEQAMQLGRRCRAAPEARAAARAAEHVDE